MASSWRIGVLFVFLAVLFHACNKPLPPQIEGRSARAAGNPIFQHHANAQRGGSYVDPALTRAAAAGVHLDPGFSGAVSGAVYAQPLFVGRGVAGKATLYVVTEQNIAYALDAATGAVLWQKNVGAPVTSADLPCGNIDPLGITGTPVIDPNTRSIFFNAMTSPDGGVTKRHLVFALSIDDGSVKPGWPVDASSAHSGSTAFVAQYQNQRGALLILNNTLYVPYGGHFGDCGDYHGWVIGISTTNPSAVQAWATTASKGGIWAPGGISSDGQSLFVSTGNTDGAAQWAGGEAVLRLSPGPTFSGKMADFFAPSNWQDLDQSDTDLGGSQPVILDVPETSPSQLVVALGKDGFAYVLDRVNLGGIGNALSSKLVSNSPIITASAAYRTSLGSYVAFQGPGAGCTSGDLTAIRIKPASAAPISGGLTPLSPPSALAPAATVAWCAAENGRGSPVVSTTDGQANPVVWAVGAEGDGRLHGFDGDTGAVIFAGGGPSDQMPTVVRRFQSPLIANGEIYVAGDNRVYAYRP